MHGACNKCGNAKGECECADREASAREEKEEAKKAVTILREIERQVDVAIRDGEKVVTLPIGIAKTLVGLALQNASARAGTV